MHECSSESVQGTGRGAFAVLGPGGNGLLLRREECDDGMDEGEDDVGDGDGEAGGEGYDERAGDGGGDM